MSWTIKLRVFGVVSILVAYGIFRLTSKMQTPAFMVAVIAIIALVAPEVLDQLPFGPSK